LFKSYGLDDKKISILFNSLAHSTLLSYQFGWEDQEICDRITKEKTQEVYNDYLIWLQELKEDNDIIEDDDFSEGINNNNNNKKNKVKSLKNIKPSLFRGCKSAIS
jgi:hypothetical protein